MNILTIKTKCYLLVQCVAARAFHFDFVRLATVHRISLKKYYNRMSQFLNNFVSHISKVRVCLVTLVIECKDNTFLNKTSIVTIIF